MPSDRASVESKTQSDAKATNVDVVEKSTADSTVSLDDARQKALAKRAYRKFDLVVIPIVTMFYLLNFLDRTNIGNARIAGLTTDLNMSAHQFSIALTVTYVPYIVVDIPSNLVIKKIGPNILLPAMVVVWGLITTFQGFVVNYGGLLAARFFLGIAEGGLIPGVILYVSYFYKRHQLQKRVAFIFSATSLSGAFSGLLARAIVQLHGQGGRPGWAWIFILEGIFTVLFGAGAYFLMPLSPSTAKFLTEEERAAVLRELEADYVPDEDEKFSWKPVLSILTAWQVWLISPIFFFAGVTVYGAAVFIPTIVNALGYDPIRSQLIAVPPFAVAFVTTLTVAILSDKYRARGVSAMVSGLVALVGYVLFLVYQDANIRYGALFLQTIGAYGVAPAANAWNVNNLAAHYRRGTGVAVGVIMSNAGGICSTWIFNDPPHFRRATRTDIGAAVAIAFFAMANVAYLSYQNAQKAKVAATADDSAKSRTELGDEHPLFKYTL